MKRNLYVFAFLILLSSSMSFAQATIVRTATAYSTIQAAINAAIAGDYISVAAGTYIEDVTVNKTVTIVGAGASSTFIVATTGNTTPLTFNAVNATVNGFTITHNYTPAELSAWTFNNNGVGFYGGSGNILTNCIVTLNRNGIYFNAAQSNNIVTSNTITNNRTGINMTGKLDGTQITGNTISDNWTVGIVTYANTVVTNYSNVTILGNTFSNNWYSEVLVKDVTTNSGVLDVSSNTFSDSPVTYSYSSDASLNEPAFESQHPVALGGTAVKPSPDLPTLRIYNNGSVSLVYSSPKTVLVKAGQFIQTAITLGNAGDNILVESGLYNENITVSKALTLKSVSGPSLTSITGTAGSPAVTISANNVTIDGFFISNPSGKWGISVVDRSGITIINNVIGNIGQTDATTSGSNYGIAVVSSSAAIDQIIIRDNTITNLVGGNYKSVQAIAIGWSNGAYDITNLLIRNNRINDIYSSTAVFASGGRGAYGIQLNHANAASYTGRTVAAQILNNTIIAVEGLWAHAIGLEGNTPSALVQGNSISTIIDHKSPTDPDAVAVMVEDNASANTVTIQFNKFESVGLGVRNATSAIVNASNNYWGDLDPSDNVLNTSTGGIDYTPALVSNADADLAAEGFQPSMNSLSVFYSSSQSGSVGKIQEGVYTARSYGTLNVSAGSYSEEVTVDKPLNIVGTGSPSTTKFIYAASPITVTGFSLSSATMVEVQPGGLVNDAIDLVQTGGTVEIVPGTYDAFVADKPMTLIGSPGVIINHGSPAITVNSTGVTIIGFTFTYDATDFAIDVLPGAYDVVIQQNRFLNTNGVNVGNAVRNQGTGSVVAFNNYWNSYTGPTIISNPGGVGNVAANTSTGTLTYSPWLGYNGANLISPANASTSIPVTPNFQWSWTWAGGAPAYTLEIAADAAFATVVYGPVAATSPFTLPAINSLNASSVYYWRITANDAGIITTSVGSFTTITPAPTLISPSNNSKGLSLTPTLSWNAVPGANLYRVTVSGLAPFTTASTSATLPALTPGVVYSWYVESSNNGGTTWSVSSATLNFTTEFLSLPANLAGSVSVIHTFDWLDVPGASAYSLEIATDIAFSSIVLTQPVVSSNYTLLPSQALTNGSTYYWRVTSNNGAISGTWSFTVVQPAMPYLTLPGNGSTIFGNIVYFVWYVIGTNATNYVLEVDDSNDFLTPIQTFSGLTDWYYNWTYTGLTPGSTYYWRITSKTSGGSIVSYSAISNFLAPGMPDVYASYPAGGVTVYGTTPSLYYYTATYYNGQFEVRYATNPSIDGSGMLNSSALSLPLTSNSYVTLPVLTPTTYYWQVRSSNGISNGNWSSVQSFSIYNSIATPVTPYLSYPVGGTTAYTNPPSLYWYIGTFAPGLQYQIRYSTDASVDGTGMLNESAVNFGSLTTDLYATFGSSLSSGTYYWQVRSFNGVSYSSWSTVGSFIIPSNASTISTPIPVYPAGGVTIYVLNPSLSYYAYSTSALEYRINYSALPGADVNGVLNSSNTTSLWTSNLNYALNALTPGVTYYWQVQARLAATPSTISSWSSVVSFTTAAGSFAVVPQIGSPNYGQPINNTSAVLSWVIPTPSSSQLKYDLQYSDKADMSGARSVSNLSSPYYQVSGLDQNKIYYWRVSSKNSSGTSGSSAVGTFKTSNVTSVEQEAIPTEFSLDQNYPNPFNPATVINYSLPINSFVTLKVFDMLGREVKTLINNEVVAGRHAVEWKGDDNSGNRVATGVYVYRVSADNFVSSKKMILIK
jgi:parallel beta-helix repeat protein